MGHAGHYNLPKVLKYGFKRFPLQGGLIREFFLYFTG